MTIKSFTLTTQALQCHAFISVKYDHPHLKTHSIHRECYPLMLERASFETPAQQFHLAYVGDYPGPEIQS